MCFRFMTASILSGRVVQLCSRDKWLTYILGFGKTQAEILGGKGHLGVFICFCERALQQGEGKEGEEVAKEVGDDGESRGAAVGKKVEYRGGDESLEMRERKEKEGRVEEIYKVGDMKGQDIEAEMEAKFGGNVFGAEGNSTLMENRRGDEEDDFGQELKGGEAQKSEQMPYHYPAVIRLFTVWKHGALKKATVSDSDLGFWDVGI